MLKQIREFFAGVALAVMVLIAFILVMLAASANAQSVGYESKQDISTSTNWAEVVFPAQGAVQAVLKGLEVQSDASTNVVNILAGTVPIPVQYSLNVTQLVVASNAGVISNQYAIISLPASNALFLVNILYTNQLTNIFVGGPGPVKAALNTTYLSGITNTNALVWICTNQSIIWPGIGRMTLDGPALFSAKVNAPLGIRAGSPTGPAGGVSNQVRRAVIERFYPSPGLVQ